MKSFSMILADEVLPQARNMAETIIGHIKAFFSGNLPKYRSSLGTFIHLIANQLKPILPNNSPALRALLIYNSGYVKTSAGRIV